MMKDQEKRLWLFEKHASCYQALDTLLAAKRQAASEYDVRIRQLSALAKDLRFKMSDSDQFELFKADEVLSAEIAELMENPLDGLD